MLKRLSVLNNTTTTATTQKTHHQKNFRRCFTSAKKESGVTVINTHTSPSSLVSNVSLFLKAGSRYETKLTRGSTHFLKHLAFRNNSEEYGLTLVRNVESLGGELLCTVDRDVIGYHIYGSTEKIEKLAPLLKGIASPKLWEYEMDEVRGYIQSEVDVVSHDLPSVVVETLYQTAFRKSGLSQDVYATEFDTSRLVGQHVLQHVTDNYYPGDRAVLVANGLNTEYQGAEYNTYENQAGTFEIDAFEPLPELTPTSQNSEFVGGEALLQGGSNVHVALGFNGASVSSENYATLLVLKEALGCGSACGGRFFNLQKENEQILQVNAFNSSFTDAGLFGIYAETTGNAADVLQQVVAELNALTKLSDEEFLAAKNVAKGRAARSNESGLYQNTLTALRHFSGSTSAINDLDNIESVTKEQVVKAVKTLLSSTPSLVTAGDIQGTPSIKTLISQ